MCLPSSGRAAEARGHKPGLLHAGPRPHSEGELGHHSAVQGLQHLLLIKNQEETRLM